jgi:hypothetical protein
MVSSLAVAGLLLKAISPSLSPTGGREKHSYGNVMIRGGISNTVFGNLQRGKGPIIFLEKCIFILTGGFLACRSIGKGWPIADGTHFFQSGRY